MSSSLKQYFQEIGRYPLLTAEEEKELSRRIKQGDQTAREKLICSNLRLVVSIAKKYQSVNMSLEDLIADGNMGLMTAVDKYDADRGTRFSTCATMWIKQAITSAIAQNSRTIRVPAYIIQQFNNYNKAVDKLMADGNLSPSDEDIAKEMGIEPDRLADLLRWRKNTISANTPLGDDDADGKTVEDLVPDSAETPDRYTERVMLKDSIMKALATFDTRTQMIIKLRFGVGADGDPDEFFEEHTLEEIGQMLTPKLSRERVRQIVNQTTAKMKRLLA